MKYDQIIQGDCIEVMKSWPDGCVDLVFADPPFNIGFEYDQYSDKMTENDYKMFTKHWLLQCGRTIKTTGSVYVMIGDEYAAQLKLIMDELFYLRNWVVWYYTFGQNCQTKFSRCHCHVFYYTASDQFTFNADAVRVPSARQERYGDKRADARGKVPEDVWTFPRLCGTFKERTNAHPCQLPEALLERVVRASSNPGDVVADPFGGSFTTAAVAKRLGRRYLSCDVSGAYCAAGVQRLSRVRTGLGVG